MSGDTSLPATTVRSAAQALATHHSRSVLVVQTLQLLRSGAGNMPTPRERLWCYPCGQYVRSGSRFCGNCAGPVSAATVEQGQYHGADARRPPWAPQAGEWWNSDTVPPPPRPPPSPRLKSPKNRRGKNNGKTGGKGDAFGSAGKGATPVQDYSSTDSTRVLAPPAGQLPKAPLVKPVPAPKQAELPPAADTSQDRKLLEAMLQHFVGRESELPEPVRGMMASFSSSHMRMETAELHKLVAVRAEAKKALVAINKERLTYEAAWQGYIAKLSTQLQQQLQERENYLVKLSEAEEQWRIKGSSASAAIARAAAEGQLTDAEAEPDETMAVEAVADVTEAAKSNREHIKQSSLQVLQALASVSSRIQEVLPERERTPRGKRAMGNSLETVESSPEMFPAKDKAAGATAADSGAVATQPVSPPQCTNQAAITHPA